MHAQGLGDGLQDLAHGLMFRPNRGEPEYDDPVIVVSFHFPGSHVELIPNTIEDRTHDLTFIFQSPAAAHQQPDFQGTDNHE